MGHFGSPLVLVNLISSQLCTIMLEKKSLSEPIILEDMEVLATFRRQFLPRSAAGTERLSWINLTDSLQASLKKKFKEFMLIQYVLTLLHKTPCLHAE